MIKIPKNTTSILTEINDKNIIVEENAVLEIYQLITHKYKVINNIQLLKNAKLNIVNLILAEKSEIVDEITEIKLNEPGVSACCYYASLALNQQNFKVDFVHNAPYTFSKQIIKVVAMGTANFNFNSKIRVEKNAQKVEALQNSKGLMLSNNAQINANPALEIYADDVKCSHGHATGFIDPEQMFYLRSRGIPESQAHKMLALAFFQDIINNINQEKIKTDFLAELKRCVDKINVEY